MKYDIVLILGMFGIGMVFRRLSWKGWMSIVLFVFVWMMWNVRRG